MPVSAPEVEPTLLAGDLREEDVQAYLASRDLAVDTETMGLNVLRDRLCVVQLYDRNGRATLVQIPKDPASPDPARRAPNLKRLLEAPEVVKVFHFARFDLGALKYHLGINVAPLYCTRTASRIARTYTDRHGLKDIALELMDVDLDKRARHTDWSSPTLTPDQVRYAISDVTLLLPLKDKLETMLERERRRELAQACFKVIPVFSHLDLLGYPNVFEHH
jgi:ribonuclease D